jgi:DNA-binding MarR family transcriptional regulator
MMVDATGFSAEEWTLWRAYRSAHGQLNRALDRQLQRDSGISQADFGVLAAIFEARDGHLRVGQLAEVLAWEKSRVSHQVTRMESRGLLQRRDCDADGRGSWIELTADGRRAFLGALRGHAAELRRLFVDLLSPAERTVLLDTSERVLEELNPALCESEKAGVPAPIDETAA